MQLIAINGLSQIKHIFNKTIYQYTVWSSFWGWFITNFRVFLSGGIPRTRRTECVKIKISQSDFSYSKFGKKVNVLRTFLGTEYWYCPIIYTKEICKNFKLSLTAAELRQTLYFKNFVRKAKYCFIYFILIEWQLILFENWFSANFVFRPWPTNFFCPFGPSRMRIAPFLSHSRRLYLRNNWHSSLPAKVDANHTMPEYRGGAISRMVQVQNESKSRKTEKYYF